MIQFKSISARFYHQKSTLKAGSWMIILLSLAPQLFFGQTITTIAGTGTSGYNGDGMAATAAELSGPQGMALDATGNIFIADLSNNRIRRIDATRGSSAQSPVQEHLDIMAMESPLLPRKYIHPQPLILISRAICTLPTGRTTVSAKYL